MTENFNLVKRYCKCGCGRHWKCMPGSKSLYFSNDDCAPQREGLARLEFQDTSSIKRELKEIEYKMKLRARSKKL